MRRRGQSLCGSGVILPARSMRKSRPLRCPIRLAAISTSPYCCWQNAICRLWSLAPCRVRHRGINGGQHALPADIAEDDLEWDDLRFAVGITANTVALHRLARDQP